MNAKLRAINHFIQVKDEQDGRPVDRWTSPDILPVLPKNRTFGKKDYVSYWYVVGDVVFLTCLLLLTFISQGFRCCLCIFLVHGWNWYSQWSVCCRSHLRYAHRLFRMRTCCTFVW